MTAVMWGEPGGEIRWQPQLPNGKRPHQGAPMTTGPWHTWFAWRPVETMQHGWKWLQAVERAKRYPDPLIPFAPDPYWVYRPRTTKENQ